MLNNNKVDEIKIILSGLLQDIDSLESSNSLSPVKWENVFISLDTIRAKLNTIKAEQDKPASFDSLLITRDEEIKKLNVALAELKRAFADVQLNVSKSFIPSISQSHKKSVLAEEPAKLFEEDGGEEIELFNDKVPILDAARSSLHSWKTDLPGTKVSDIRSAITLNDKLFFIKELFNDDEEQYRLSIERLNEMHTLEEAIDYIRGAFPEWEEDSNGVYRFLMIMRRRYDV